MFNEATDALKFDNRLRARREWVSPDELAQALAALPDSADKVLAPGEEPEARRSTRPPSPIVPVPEAAPAPEAAPVADSPFAALAGTVTEPTASFGGDAADDGSDFGGTHDA